MAHLKKGVLYKKLHFFCLYTDDAKGFISLVAVLILLVVSLPLAILAGMINPGGLSNMLSYVTVWSDDVSKKVKSRQDERKKWSLE